jgi:hypothetical protein
MSPPQAGQSRIILLAAYDETPALNRQYHTLCNRPRATMPQGRDRNRWRLGKAGISQGEF